MMDVPRTPSILVVEDEARVLFTLDYLLQHYGYEVTPACNGAEAIAHILRDDFDLLLIDLQLPDFNGLEIAWCAREHQPDAGILILTGSNLFGGPSIEELVAPFDCILKTASPPEVLKRVALALAQPCHPLLERSVGT
jgi:DNA-binding response OmpR family regulator